MSCRNVFLNIRRTKFCMPAVRPESGNQREITRNQEKSQEIQIRVTKAGNQLEISWKSVGNHSEGGKSVGNHRNPEISYARVVPLSVRPTGCVHSGYLRVHAGCQRLHAGCQRLHALCHAGCQFSPTSCCGLGRTVLMLTGERLCQNSTI